MFWQVFRVWHKILFLETILFFQVPFTQAHLFEEIMRIVCQEEWFLICAEPYPQGKYQCICNEVPEGWITVNWVEMMTFRYGSGIAL